MAIGDREPTGFRPEDAVAWTLVQAGRAAGDRFIETFAEVGLTKHEFGALMRLSITPGVSQAALAREILVTPQSMGPIVHQLVERGLVRRALPAVRGTAIAVELTDEGRRALAAALPSIAAVTTPASLGLDAAEAATLNALLHRVHDHLRGG